ncbi:MAG: tetratricopeptide repeat protein [Bacillota bacterium]
MKNPNTRRNLRPKPSEILKSGGRVWFFRTVSIILIPPLLLLLLEGVLVIANYGHPSGFFIKSRAEGREVWTENLKFTWSYFPRKLARESCHLIIPARKAPGTVRIFILGSSAAMGDPDFSYSFGRILEVMLRKEYPGVRFEVYNTAVTAINSHVIRKIAGDCGRLRPDLFVVYMGNNEVVGPYGPGTVFSGFSPSLAAIRANIALKNMRLGQLADSLIQSARGVKDKIPEKWAGMEMFQQNQLPPGDPRLKAVYGYFRRNLEDICRIGDRAGARVVLCTVATNLRDCPPFASLHKKGLTGDLLEAWNGFYEKGMEAESGGRLKEAWGWYRKAAEIDGLYADLQYRLARCYEGQGQYKKAGDCYIKARDYDALRFRADSRINGIIRNTAVKLRARLADVEQKLNAASPHQISGAEFLWEHVHLNFRGNYLLALSVLEQTGQMMAARKTKKYGVPPSERECADLLGFTAWDERRIAQDILLRMEKPPFTSQLDHEARLKSLKNRWPAPDKSSEAIRPDEMRIYDDALENNPDDWIVRYNYSRYQQSVSTDRIRAIENLRRVIEKVPQHHEAYNDLGLLLAQTGRSGEGISCLRESLRLKPDNAKVYNNLGLVMNNLGRFDEAIDYFRKTLSFGPPYPELVYNNLGLAYSRLQRSGEAMKYYRKALAIKPDFPEVYNNIGYMLLKEKKSGEAVEYLEKALALNPGYFLARWNYADALSDLDRYNEAIRQYREILKQKPNFAEVLNSLGIIFAEQGKYAEAEAYFARAVKADPNLKKARQNLEKVRQILAQK